MEQLIKSKVFNSDNGDFFVSAFKKQLPLGKEKYFSFNTKSNEEFERRWKDIYGTIINDIENESKTMKQI